MASGTGVAGTVACDDAFAVLIERYRGALVSLALDRTGRFDIADEIAQEAIVKAWECRNGLRDLRALRGWLFRVAINACVGWYRREDRFSALPEDADSVGTAEPVLAEVLRRQTVRDARRALSSLPPKTRVAFLMQVFGYSYAEIAAFLHLPPAAVRGRIARARERVRGALGARLKAALARDERNDNE